MFQCRAPPLLVYNNFNFMKQGSRRAIERAGEARGWVGGVYALRLSTRMPDTRGTQMPDRGTDRETTHKTTVRISYTRLPARPGARRRAGPGPGATQTHGPRAPGSGARTPAADRGDRCRMRGRVVTQARCLTRKIHETRSLSS